jgi:hypothetical protein
MIPVKGHPNLYRDERTGAIVNYDSQAYNQYIAIKNGKENQKKEIESIKNDILEIKLLLKELLNGAR